MFSASLLANFPPRLDVPRGWDPVSLRCGLKQARDRGTIWKNDGKRHRERQTPPAWGRVLLQVLGTDLFLAVLQGRHIADLNSLPVGAHTFSFH